MRLMPFKEAIKWVDDFQKFGVHLGLDRIQLLVKIIGHPEQKLQCIHVAGTNGKGSVCRYINEVLLTAGYKVGLYVSPHLETVLERFSINNNMISKKEFALIASKIKPVVDELITRNLTPTYFEVSTAMMFLWFAEKDVDYAVIEVGMGGRFDATNIVHPLVSIITNVTYDHTNILGDTIEKIAFEKAGIIKKNISVVTAAEKSALSIIQNEAKNLHAMVYKVDPSQVSLLSSDEHGQIMQIKGLYRDYTLETYNLGTFQIENVSVALLALDVLQMQGVFLPDNVIETGIKHMKHPGRMEIVHQRPLLILDGAHNPSAMDMLSKTIKHLFAKRHIIVVFGVMVDKAVDEIIVKLLTFADSVIVTSANISRAMKPAELVDHILKVSSNINMASSQTLAEGLRQALVLATNEDVIIVTGSLYLVGEARKFLKGYFANT